MVPGNLSQLAKRLHVKFVAGSLALDFVNTVGGRGRRGAAIRDKLGSYEDLLGWSLLAGTLDRGVARALQSRAALHPRQAATVLKRAVRLREALYRIFTGARAEASVLRVEAAVARAEQQLVRLGRRYVWTLPKHTHALDRILWPVSLSAAELLISDDLARVGRCGGIDCGWLFLDTSRNRRRRWCDMQDCGNRAKVQRFRAKSRGTS